MTFYHAFMDEISPDILYKGLLAFGLFSEKMPPIFTAEYFYYYSTSIRHNFEEKPHAFVYYENMRDINVPRALAIPNPMAYQQLCKCLSANWSDIKNHFRSMTSHQAYKVSRIHLRRMHETSALFQINYENWRIDGSPEIDISFGKHYMVKADISSCFPSIYTHAIPWALVTRTIAKATKDDQTWYNAIDRYARHIKHDETHGLLIGPHASNLLSEIVLTAVDKELSQWDYIRNIDDYICYTDTFEQGQKFLTELGAALRLYDLSLNHKKTEILELPLAASEHWIRRLNAIPMVTNYGKTDYNLAQAYLDHAIELMHENKAKSSILLYAIKVLAGKALTPNAQEYCAKAIMNLSMLYPYLVTAVDKYVFQRYCNSCTNHTCIEKYANIIYKKGLETHNYEQVVYALFFAIKYNFNIHNFIIGDSIGSNDCIYLVFAYLYLKAKNLRVEARAMQAHAYTLSLDEDTFDQYWIFIYEALPETKLSGEWKAMKRRKITFIRSIQDW